MEYGEIVGQLIERFPRRREGAYRGTWLEATIAKGLLPIYSDWTCSFAMDREGGLLFCIANDWVPVTNPYYRHIVLAEASRRFPELIALAPERGLNDVDCIFCGGTGLPVVAGRPMRELICDCGGMGWKPPGPYPGRPGPDEDWAR